MAVDLPNAFTVLTLTGMGVAPYSARGLSQTLEPIPQATQVVRTINGELIDIAPAQFRKYRSTISCSDVDAPALSGIWPGQTLTVSCIAELGSISGAIERPAVAGSTRTEDGVTYYRPILTMRVTNFSQTTDEYGHVTSWTLTLEEV